MKWPQSYPKSTHLSILATGFDNHQFHLLISIIAGTRAERTSVEEHRDATLRPKLRVLMKMMGLKIEK